MSDKNKIPRTFAGEIGVADVTDAVKRHYLTIPTNGNGTTGIFFGGDSTTGFKPFRRNATLEKFIAVFQANTTVAETTVFKVKVMNGATTLFLVKKSYSTTYAEKWHQISTAPASASVTSSTKFRVQVVTKHAAIKRLSLMLVFKEALDS